MIQGQKKMDSRHPEKEREGREHAAADGEVEPRPIRRREVRGGVSYPPGTVVAERRKNGIPVGKGTWARTSFRASGLKEGGHQ